MTTNKFIKILIGVALVTGSLAQAKADGTATDPTGTYIWTMPGRNGGPDRTNTLVLKLDGTNLTGNLLAPRRGGVISTNAISGGTISGANISFAVVRSYNDNTFTNSYTGTLTNGTITGQVSFQRDGDTQTHDWVAKKQ